MVPPYTVFCGTVVLIEDAVPRRRLELASLQNLTEQEIAIP